MRRVLLIIFWIAGIGSLCYANPIDIPLIVAGAETGLIADGPKGSTPDPFDPNQIRATLIGNTLHIEKDAGTDSYVVIQECQKERMTETYYDLKSGTIIYPITRPGQYVIRISSSGKDYTGCLQVNEIYVCNSNGQRLDYFPDSSGGVPYGLSFVLLETSLGITTSKFYRFP